MYDHIADSIKSPTLIKLRDNLSFARFEILKVCSTLTAIEQLLAAEAIKPGHTLLDSSSGIYAHSLALACHRHGMKCRIIASKTVDKTLLVQLNILGAEVEQVQSAGSLKMDQSRRVERIKEILASESDVYWMQQYHDTIHYNGYQPVAQQIAREFEGEALTIVGPCEKPATPLNSLVFSPSAVSRLPASKSRIPASSSPGSAARFLSKMSSTHSTIRFTGSRLNTGCRQQWRYSSATRSSRGCRRAAAI